MKKYDVSDHSGRTFPGEGGRTLFNQNEGDDKSDKPPPPSLQRHREDMATLLLIQDRSR